MSTLIQIQNIHKSYGTNVLFDGASARFAANHKVGVIGRNGAGKTTLCRILTDAEELDAGEVTQSPELRLSYLEQGNPFELDETILGFLTRYTEREEWRCAKIAGRFLLKGEMLRTRIAKLPGGFQTRVKLTAMLLREPNFLILDEPTNYLDLTTLMLLERFLRAFNGGYLIVSHDREFLKQTCKQTLEVEGGQLTFFPGNVEAYFAFKEEQLEQKIRYNRNIKDRRKQLQRFVDRYRVRASTASQAQSKLKQLERLQSIEIESPITTARIKIPQVEERKGLALRCEELAIGYPDKEVASGIRLEIERGEHVAVLGDNGEGKTTFLRTIAGELAPRDGSFQWGHKLKCSYYAQHVYATLNQGLDVYTHLEQESAQQVTSQDVLDMAGSFLFRGDDVSKVISALSGGERARVCLGGILLRRHPVLLLDEPTNHLDFETVEALANALKSYHGTIFFVSHDRTFVNLLATSIVEVKNGRVVLYPSDYETYVYRTEREIRESEGADARGPTLGRDLPAQGMEKTTDYHRRKEQRARVNKLKRRIEDAERRLDDYREEQERLHQYFLENPFDRAPDRPARDKELTQLVAEAETEWLTLQDELERFEEL